MRSFLKIIALSTAFLGFTHASLSHELWIDTPNFEPATGDEIPIELRNGQMFKGISLSFFNNRVQELYFDLTGRIDADSRMGDMPAMIVPPQKDGLLRVVYVSKPDVLTYAKWEKFVDFTNHKDAIWACEEHVKQGFPQDGFKEVYTRYSKALIGVGTSQGVDENFGLEIEITALLNPYTDNMTNGLPVDVRYRNIPRINAQIEVFERSADGSTQNYTLRTDDHGQAIIPVKSGHTYLLDSVVLRAAPNRDSTQTEPLWQSLWAALTFKVP